MDSEKPLGKGFEPVGSGTASSSSAPRRREEDTPFSFLNLQDSERSVLLAAALIYSSYIQKGRDKESDPQDLMEEAVEVAIQMAQRVDKRVYDKKEAQ